VLYIITINIGSFLCILYTKSCIRDYLWVHINWISKQFKSNGVYFIVFYSKCDISMDNSKLFMAYIQLYEQKFIINSWFVEEYLLQSFEKFKSITIYKILEKRDILIKSLWSLCVKFMKSWLRRYSEAHYIQSASCNWFIYQFGLTYLHYFQHVRFIGWRPN
jgi:hypothetical protein